jgi:hypothetical protein
VGTAESEVAFRLWARSSTATSTGAFSNTNRLSNSGWPLGSSLFLDRHQRQVFVLAQLHVAVEQPLNHWRTLRADRPRELHAQGDAVDEQADGALHLRHVHRAPGHGDAEQHVAIAAQRRSTRPRPPGRRC